MKKFLKQERSLFIIFLLSVLVIFINISWKTNVIPFKINTVNDSIAIDTNSRAIAFDKKVNEIYKKAQLNDAGLSYPLFEKSLIGYYNLSKKKIAQKPILTIVDFTKSSKEKRMWIIDLAQQQLLLTNLVAHGQRSGDDIATKFSNMAESHQSSLGFFVTDEIYFGKHGQSLKLEGLDKGFNSLAKSRAIVLHGAAYVSEDFIKQHGRLGRSFGCPAVPQQLTSKVINLLKGKTTLFINGNSNYKSLFLDKQNAINALLSQPSANNRIM